MAILDTITVGEKRVLQIDADPSLNTTAAPIGTLAMLETGGNVGQAWLKTGSSDTAWSQLVSTASSPVAVGSYLRLPIYSSNPTGAMVGDTVQQNSQNINISIATQASRSAAINYLIPNPGDAVTSANFVLTEGAQTINGAKTFGSAINMSNNLISGVLDPVSAQDAATKAYVDGIAQGISWKNPVKAATTANITLSAPQTIDGVSVVASDRVLVKNQATASQNGIYIVQAGAWTRATDADVASEIVAAAVYVDQGTLNADTAWVQTANAPITLGTTNLTFVQFAGAGTYTAGNGLSLTGTQFSVNLATNPGLTFSSGALTILLNGSTLALGASGLSVAAGGITNTEINASAAIARTKLAALTANKLMITDGSGFDAVSAGSGFVKATSGTPAYQASISLTADVSGILPVANGGTNSSTALNNNRIMVSTGGAIQEAAALTNGQLLIGSTGAAPVAAALTGTTNQVTVTNGAGSITLSTPQNIHTAATPTFGGLTLSNITQGSVTFGGSGGVTSQNNANFFWDNTNVRLGLGTATPGRLLDVNGTSLFRGAIRYADAGAAKANYEVVQAQVSTTNNTVTTVATIAIPTDSSVMLEVRVQAKRTGGSAGTAGDSAAYVRHVKANNIGGTVTLGTVQSTFTSEDQGGWNLTLDVSTTNVRVRALGATNNNIDWTCTYIVQSLS